MTAPSDPRLDLVAYLDGELDPEAARAVEELLAADPAARAELQALEGTWQALDALDELPVRPGWLRDTERKILATAGPKRARVVRFPGARAMWAVAAALLLTAGLALLIAVASPGAEPELAAPTPDQPAPRAGEGGGLIAPDSSEFPQPVRTPRAGEAPRRPPSPPTPREVAPTPEPLLAELEAAELEAAGLDAEDLEVIENLELLALLGDFEETDLLADLDVLDSLEILEDLEAEEFDEG